MTSQLPLAHPLEPRLLFNNEFVGDTFAWNGPNEGRNSSLRAALHPSGYWILAFNLDRTTLALHEMTGAAVGSPIELHPGEARLGPVPVFDRTEHVSSDAQGDAVVVWSDRWVAGQPGQITFQLFDPTGQPRNQPTRVFPEHNYQGQEDDTEQTVDMNDDGTFDISWRSKGPTSGNTCYTRMFNADGTPKSGPIQMLPPDIPGDLAVEHLTALNDGGFMVQNVRRRIRYSATGTMVGQPIQIIPSTVSGFDTATDSTGRTVVRWLVPDVPNNGLSSIFMQTFDIAGNSMAPPAVVGKFATFGGGSISIGLDEDRVIFSWNRSGGVIARQMHYDGTPIGVNFAANRSFRADFPHYILFHPDSYLIGFDGSDGTVNHYYAQAFDDHGTTPFSAALNFELNGYDARCSFGVDPRCYHQLINATFNTPVMYYTTTTSAHGVRITNLATNAVETPVLQRSADGLSMKVLPSAKFVADGNYRVTIPRFEWGDALGNVPDAALSLDYFFLSADLDLDRQVAISDFIRLAANYEKTNAIYTDGDVNYDGVVSIADFITLASRLGRTLDAPATPQAASSSVLSASDDQQITTTHKNRRRHHHRVQPDHPALLRIRN